MLLMNENELKILSKSYAPIIKSLIEQDAKFFMFKETIKWAFNYGEESAVIAAVGKDNVVHINFFSVMSHYLAEDLYTVEYFLLHEIRHIFQHLIIDDYYNGKEVPFDSKLVEQWIFEDNNENYIKALDENGNENDGYFKQDIEIDAYAFSLAVMKYKYDEKLIQHLYVPHQFGDAFLSIVNDWIRYFKEEKL